MSIAVALFLFVPYCNDLRVCMQVLVVLVSIGRHMCLRWYIDGITTAKKRYDTSGTDN